MVWFTTKHGDDIYLNISTVDRLDDDCIDLSQEADIALDLLKSLPTMKRPNTEHFTAAELLFDEGVCFSPSTIFKLPLNRNICRYLNDISTFGTDLRKELTQAGAFAFLEKARDPGAAQGVLERFLCVFTASAVGLSRVEDAPLDFIHAVVDLFRSEDGLGWNSELLGVGDANKQCVSNIISGLATIFKDTSLVHKARKHRVVLPPFRRTLRRLRFGLR